MYNIADLRYSRLGEDTVKYQDKEMEKEIAAWSLKIDEIKEKGNNS